MNATDIEILYIERRIRDTLGMAKACVSSCGKRVHLELADMYSVKLQQLRAAAMPEQIRVEMNLRVPDPLMLLRLKRLRLRMKDRLHALPLQRQPA